MIQEGNPPSILLSRPTETISAKKGNYAPEEELHLGKALGVPGAVPGLREGLPIASPRYYTQSVHTQSVKTNL